MSDFGDRLGKAILRGERIKQRGRQEARGERLSREDAKNRHSAGRLEMTEAIEGCLRSLVDHFPGFNYAPVHSENGWGGRVSRDDLRLGGRGPKDEYSRLELVVPPLGEALILSLTGKATVRNKELFNRSHYQKLEDLDLESFRETLDLWVLEYAERYQATS